MYSYIFLTCFYICALLVLLYTLYMCVCVYAYVCIYVCVYIYIGVYVCACIYMHICVDVCVYLYKQCSLVVSTLQIALEMMANLRRTWHAAHYESMSQEYWHVAMLVIVSAPCCERCNTLLPAGFASHISMGISACSTNVGNTALKSSCLCSIYIPNVIVCRWDQVHIPNHHHQH